MLQEQQDLVRGPGQALQGRERLAVAQRFPEQARAREASLEPGPVVRREREPAALLLVALAEPELVASLPEQRGLAAL